MAKPPMSKPGKKNAPESSPYTPHRNEEFHNYTGQLNTNHYEQNDYDEAIEKQNASKNPVYFGSGPSKPSRQQIGPARGPKEGHYVKQRPELPVVSGRENYQNPTNATRAVNAKEKYGSSFSQHDVPEQHTARFVMSSTPEGRRYSGAAQLEKANVPFSTREAAANKRATNVPKDYKLSDLARSALVEDPDGYFDDKPKKDKDMPPKKQPAAPAAKTPAAPRVTKAAFSNKSAATPETPAATEPKVSNPIAESKARKQARVAKPKVTAPAPKTETPEVTGAPDVKKAKATATKARMSTGSIGSTMKPEPYNLGSGSQWNNSSRTHVATRMDEAKVPRGSERESDYARDTIHTHNPSYYSGLDKLDDDDDFSPKATEAAPKVPTTSARKQNEDTDLGLPGVHHEIHVPLSERQPNVTYYSHSTGPGGSKYTVHPADGGRTRTVRGGPGANITENAEYTAISKRLHKGAEGHVLASETTMRRPEPGATAAGRAPSVTSSAPHRAVNTDEIPSAPKANAAPKASASSAPPSSPRSFVRDDSRQTFDDKIKGNSSSGRAPTGSPLKEGFKSVSPGVKSFGEMTYKAAKYAGKAVKEGVKTDVKLAGAASRAIKSGEAKSTVKNSGKDIDAMWHDRQTSKSPGPVARYTKDVAERTYAKSVAAVGVHDAPKKDTALGFMGAAARNEISSKRNINPQQFGARGGEES